jgi:preprotein translocase subunit YajC
MNAGGLIVLVGVFALFWVLFVMPQRRRVQAQRELVEGVAAGDEIVTVGGLIGRVRSLDGDDELTLEIAPGTEVRLARRAVAAVLSDDAKTGSDPPAAS